MLQRHRCLDAFSLKICLTVTQFGSYLHFEIFFVGNRRVFFQRSFKPRELLKL